MFLVVIDSSENPEQPDSWLLGPLNSTSTGCGDGAVPLPRACGGCGFGEGTSPGCPAMTRMRRFQTFPSRPRNGEVRAERSLVQSHGSGVLPLFGPYFTNHESRRGWKLARPMRQRKTKFSTVCTASARPRSPPPRPLNRIGMLQALRLG